MTVQPRLLRNTERSDVVESQNECQRVYCQRVAIVIHVLGMVAWIRACVYFSGWDPARWRRHHVGAGSVCRSACVVGHGGRQGSTRYHQARQYMY